MPATSVSRLSDRALLSRLKVLAQRERLITIDILKHLNEVEQRRLHVTLGYSSMFDYCTRCLRYSASGAARRIRTARCIRRYPVVASLIRKGDVNLSTVSLIASVLDDHNSETLIERIRHKSQREVESITAEYRAPVRLRDRVRPVRVRVARAAASLADENRTPVSDYCQQRQ